LETPLDRAYDNRAFIPDADSFSPRWAAQAHAFRERAAAQLDMAYGIGPRERYDLFLPEVTPEGLTVFIHGGYWMAFDKSAWSHLAAGPLAYGHAVMVPSYPLCPTARVAEIVAAVGAAITHGARKVAGPIRLVGHSAGGQLAARMACTDAPLPTEIAERIARVVAISGIHDLRPLLWTQMNETLQMDLAEARRHSPALLEPADVDVVAWVGDGERPQLRRQSRLLALVWEGLAPSVRHVEAADRHHLNVVEDLAVGDSALTSTLMA